MLFGLKNGPAPQDQEAELLVAEGISYFSFPALRKTGLVRHAFSTRLGGASTGDFASMNLGFNRGDAAENVLENYRRMAAVLGTRPERMVLSSQTHTTNVRVVTEEDAGKGIFREKDYQDVDGLITDIPGLVLVTFYADCIPLFFVDTKRRAAGLAHSGWRGTVNRMGEVCLKKMREAFGTDPADVIACIGPGICRDCYEVGPEVAGAFIKAFGTEQKEKILLPGEGGKFQLDLWAANRQVLIDAGLPEVQIHTARVCTRHNSGLLFSHRAMGTKRGSLAAFLGLL